MSNPTFIHLRMHSEFSVNDGIVRIDEAVAKAKSDGQGALALTDLGNTFGLIKFYNTSIKAGVKPIMGADVWVTNPDDLAQPTRLLLLIKNRAGYLRLCDLLSRAYMQEERATHAQLHPSWLFDEAGANHGLIALSGAHWGDVGQMLLKGKTDEAEARVHQWRRAFNDQYYLEVQRLDTPESTQQTLLAAELAFDTKTPLVATHAIQFLTPDEHRAHEARVCISQGEILSNPRRVAAFSPCQYLMTQAEMTERFADLPSALTNSVAIAQMCNLTLDLGKPQLPDFPTPNGETIAEYTRTLSHQGLEERLVKLYSDPAKREAERERYVSRLNIELDTIIQMGFPGYFLIVADFINWAKENDVPVGPGRGSGAGSLVAYALKITDLDPLAYDLLFERFLNPERVSMPDFDIDFCQDGRDSVIQYVKDHYGHDAVSQIATFGTLGAKAVIRDVGRVLDMPYNYCDSLSKLIPHDPANPWTLEKTLAEEPTFKERVENEEEAQEIVALAKRLEGLTRNIGMHAGGVLIAPGKLTDFCPVYCAMGTNSVVSQYDKNDVEAIGLVKFDFLGLRNLTILKLAVKYLKDLNPDMVDFVLEDLPLNDPKVFDIFTKGNTTAVFQSESRSAKDLEKKLKPDSFEDIIALMALNRPGPLGSGMVDDFIARKKEQVKTGRGNDAWYFDNRLKPVLESTYGVMVYQEQVMLVAQILGGYSLGGADLLRRAMGKKDAAEMARQRDVFAKGASERGVSVGLATELFNLMEKFADYGFNKSHSAAYALIAYQTAWFKAYHPAEFMAATMSSDMDDTDKVQIFYQDSVEDNGLTILPPNINESHYNFVPTNAKTIRYGLGAIKGSGQAAIEAIVREREANGAFTSFFDFCMRVDKQLVNRRTLEALIKAGAFDTLHENRASVLDSVEHALEAALHAEQNKHQNSLFDDAQTLNAEWQNQLAQTAPWTLREKLANEKSAIGFYLSGHLYDEHEAEVNTIVKTRLNKITPQREPVLFAGIITAVRTMFTKRGKMMFVTLDDKTARVEVSVFNETFERYSSLLKEEHLVIISGTAKKDDYTGGVRVVADKVMDMALAKSAQANNLIIHVNTQQSTFDVSILKTILTSGYDEDGLPILVHVYTAGASADIRLGLDWRVIPKDTLLSSLENLPYVESVEVI
ncbi:DNA-directed DNA polymerase [Formosimonas limnophila]|uniref:DNA polymerase III subunit alpha n=1 Tax=Formosimonas limnophila TaxID=1384487 RepID=A0A8J3CHA2_9BURK|nr:DNA polymerase III subunit alpha [Formosimonas limnophila]GHA73340.1 DNA-directed DNA polymerase [Formosimonas limnophila]